MRKVHESENRDQTEKNKPKNKRRKPKQNETRNRVKFAIPEEVKVNENVNN